MIQHPYSWITHPRQGYRTAQGARTQWCPSQCGYRTADNPHAHCRGEWIAKGHSMQGLADKEMLGCDTVINVFDGV